MSLGAQTFAPRLLEVLERVAGPDDVRRAFHTLRDASFDNISLDLIYGIPGQEPADLDHDLAEALALAPEHLSLYELEAKPGTRFTHAWGDELERQSEAMEGYFERVVETLTSAGYRWYETANFCLTGERAGGRDLRSHHNLGTWHGRDYLGVGIGAVSTLGQRCDAATVPRSAATSAALGAGERPAARARAARCGDEGAGARDARPPPRRAVAARRARGGRRSGRARADGGGRPRDRRAWAGGRGDAHADAARPVPRRRRHGRAAPMLV